MSHIRVEALLPLYKLVLIDKLPSLDESGVLEVRGVADEEPALRVLEFHPHTTIVA